MNGPLEIARPLFGLSILSRQTVLKSSPASACQGRMVRKKSRQPPQGLRRTNLTFLRSRILAFATSSPSVKRSSSGSVPFSFLSVRQVNQKSRAVIDLPSLQRASFLIVYVSEKGLVSILGSPTMRFGTKSPVPFGEYAPSRIASTTGFGAPLG